MDLSFRIPNLTLNPTLRNSMGHLEVQQQSLVLATIIITLKLLKMSGSSSTMTIQLLDLQARTNEVLLLLLQISPSGFQSPHVTNLPRPLRVNQILTMQLWTWTQHLWYLATAGHRTVTHRYLRAMHSYFLTVVRPVQFLFIFVVFAIRYVSRTEKRRIKVN